MFWRLALRNLLRHKRRSLLTALAFMGGALTMVLTFGIADGMYGDMIDLATLSFPGHAQIHAAGYRDNPSIYTNIKREDAPFETLASTDGVVGFAPRVFGQALLSHDEETTGAMIIGIDPVAEETVTAISKKVTTGQMLPDGPSGTVLVGVLLADILHAKVGDPLVMVGQAADGSMANEQWTIAGLIKTGMADMDRRLVLAHIKDVQAAYALDGRLHELAIRFADVNQIASHMATLKKALHGKVDGLEVLDWREVLPTLHNAIAADRMGGYLFLFIIAVICALVVLNTVLMSVLERTRELGILKALGTRPLQVGRLVVYETLLLSLLATSAGMGLGFLIIFIVAHSGGIPLGEGMAFGGVVIDSLSARFSDRTLYLSPAVIMGTGLLVSVFPAIRAGRIIPVKAIHQK